MQSIAAESRIFTALAAVLNLATGFVGQAGAQGQPAADRVRIGGLIGAASNSFYYDTSTGHPVHPLVADWTVIVDRPVARLWAARVEAGTVAWAVAPREDFPPSGSPVVVPADHYLERRVTLQVVRAPWTGRPSGLHGEFHAGIGAFWTRFEHSPSAFTTKPGAVLGWDGVLPMTSRVQVLGGVNIEAIPLGSSTPDTPYVLFTGSLRIGARIGF